MSALVAVECGIRALRREVYKQTGHQVQAVGLALSDEVFHRFVTSHCSRTNAAADVVEVILAHGFVEFTYNDGYGDIPVRVVRADVL